MTRIEWDICVVILMKILHSIISFVTWPILVFSIGFFIVE